MELFNTPKNDIYRFEEHEVFPKPNETMSIFDELKQQIEYVELAQNISELKFLGMDLVPHKPQMQMGYYIGVDWIDRKNGIAIEVLPKIKNIDFQKMLIQCFKHKESSERIEDIFYFRADDKPICIPSTDFQLEPFVIINYLGMVCNIVDKGLKSNFIVREEKLNGKIKGKIMTSQYLKHGYAVGRKDQIDCKYQEYCIDCPENRLLKSALLVIQKEMNEQDNAWKKSLFTQYRDKLNKCLSAFSQVTDAYSASALQTIHVSPMFFDYRAAMHLAKIIIRKQGIGISQSLSDGTQMVPPFIINMALLFEKYVYSLLLDRFDYSMVPYQKGTAADKPDFLKPDEHLVIDTKYILKWEDHYVTDNIRQLSGYGRNLKIRKDLGITDTVSTCPCLVIYPNRNGIIAFSTESDHIMTHDTENNENRVKGENMYQMFYKLPIRLPMITE